MKQFTIITHHGSCQNLKRFWSHPQKSLLVDSPFTSGTLVGVIVGFFVTDGVRVIDGVKVIVGVNVILGVGILVGISVFVGLGVHVGAGVQVGKGIGVLVGASFITTGAEPPL